jgi:hypothetical protein
MKKLIVLMCLLLGQFATAQVSYNCFGSKGTKAELKVYPTSPVSASWNDISQTAGSSAKFIGIEQAPFSDKRGMMLFDLVDFYHNNTDSRFVLALPPNVVRVPRSLSASVYFDHDDHEEDNESFGCRLTSR